MDYPLTPGTLFMCFSCILVVGIPLWYASVKHYKAWNRTIDGKPIPKAHQVWEIISWFITVIGTILITGFLLWAFWTLIYETYFEH